MSGWCQSRTWLASHVFDFAASGSASYSSRVSETSITPLKSGGRPFTLLLLGGEKPDRFVVDDPGDGAVVLGALCAIRSGARAFKQGVKFGIGVVSERKRTACVNRA
jgi:hypothetical protein